MYQVRETRRDSRKEKKERKEREREREKDKSFQFKTCQNVGFVLAFLTGSHSLTCLTDIPAARAIYFSSIQV